MQHTGSFLHPAGPFSGHTDSLVVARWLQSAWARWLQPTGLVAQNGMWDLSSPTRDWTRVACIARQIPNHWTTRKVPSLPFCSLLFPFPFLTPSLFFPSFSSPSLSPSDYVVSHPCFFLCFGFILFSSAVLVCRPLWLLQTGVGPQTPSL